MVNMKKNDRQKGNILVSSMLILVTMNLMGVGLIYKSAKEANIANYKTIDSKVFQATESCVHDVITYFEGQSATPATVDDITVSSLDFMLTGSESTEELNKLDGYSYGCTITFITSKSVSAGTGIGGSVDSSGSEYGGTGGTVLKDYYQVVSTGTGPNNSQKVLNSIISVEY